MTFNQWLRKQRDRDDPIGDLARDYIDDCRRRKIGAMTAEELRNVVSVGVLFAVDEAYVAYKRSLGWQGRKKKKLKTDR